MKDLAIVLVSGGMDSCVTAAIAHTQYELALLHVNYGQRTESRELKAFHDIASFYNVPKEKILISNIDYLSKIGGSSLTDRSMSVPDAQANTEEIPTSYVPFRNTHLLAIAVSWGEVIGARKIFIGAVEQDSPGYPDCKPAYYEAINNLIKVGTKPTTSLEVETPLIHMKKSEIIKIGISLEAPLNLSWSCYQNTEKACGLCHSCFLRLKAFQEAGVKDPIPYDKPKPVIDNEGDSYG
ncbi:MAG: 7-cyano-7-deazaguanine synthase QueC [Planctomycetia bacterium]|uniref:7-cyano-7-deazaguanine synthase n=1 Tax=Candidatus Brocadia sapporoensis TaxID=392547 RepID=A0A1V6M0A1_9BACT|nr:7-cyano-7-deazaguanine synthase QueC [Candidatus Brocadia sapporoensis]MCC7240239.1 7-cyano-7-deazaguanine synthase QueC [Candidatus Brocadia sp.]QOJ06847.1 MAG: 7-cyano-7-deazaguanine synthase QueC [Planctomycetia bacterium]TVL96491.1 MAG: 7-cyano-7-deazaguanine synthase QueC [Candidatus Brocadia sp. BL1]MDG6005097.1 7-cyano-7-deazaguanine synthase QueC [Candidatus Brocadia sp.]OQD45776.1 7-cyano-7-deazaguanine synthase QueC [Candidatus Brocadia sapporoensis]